MDLYEALIGATPEGPEQTRAIAEQLRRRANYGLLGQITGDPVLSQVGGGMLDRSQEQSKFLGEQDRAAKQRALTQGYYTDLGRQHNERVGLERWRTQNQREALELADGRFQTFNKFTGKPEGEPFGPEAPPESFGAGDKNYVYDDVKELAKRLQPYADTTSTIGQIDRLIAPYVSKTDEGDWRAKDIPGIGRGQGLPGAQLFRSERGNEIYGRVQELRNIILKLRSGAAVTPYEQERLDAAMQHLNTANEQNWMDQYLLAREQVDLAINSVYSGFVRPGVIPSYVQNPYGSPVLPVGEYRLPEEPEDVPWNQDWGESEK